MPSMYEIYNQHAFEYDELVNSEDYQNNLQRELNEIISQREKVLELGTGTGRVTRLYADLVKSITCCERAAHMLEKAKLNLREFNSKIIYHCMDTRDLNTVFGKYDLIIEGWALGHTAIDEFANLEQFTTNLISNLKEKLAPGGLMIFIETMGTAVDQPAPPDSRLADFYHLLENKYKMERRVIRTDYRFNDLEEARRIMSFFFGEEILAKVKSNIVEEYTGIWTLSI